VWPQPARRYNLTTIAQAADGRLCVVSCAKTPSKAYLTDPADSCPGGLLFLAVADLRLQPIGVRGDVTVARLKHQCPPMPQLAGDLEHADLYGLPIRPHISGTLCRLAPEPERAHPDLVCDLSASHPRLVGSCLRMESGVSGAY